MILFTNGCSWTWGGGLEPYFGSNYVFDHDKRQELVWPHHLGKFLNADKVINLSSGCGSNQRIVRTTFDWFINDYKNNEPIVAVIQMTDPARYEYYLTDSLEDFTNDPLYWTKLAPRTHLFHVKKNDSNEPINSWDPAWKERDIEIERERNYRLSTYTLIEGMYKTIGHCSALAHLFEKHNVEYYFFGGCFGFRPNYPDQYKNYLSKLNYLDFKWDEVEPISNADMHPSILGHKQLAELIYKIIRP